MKKFGIFLMAVLILQGGIQNDNLRDQNTTCELEIVYFEINL